ncbi:hypothetical protein EJB05_16219 [Eragrostis curvula]|uniref:RING-CH-type domain-containing protein n=1 Tax=Eragrostis curvula TaxID=38414 RepID=A0A5J9VG21_9POAL|nr:hypothetical protein EJB05_16219 [Eragrostis curvula]
MPPAWFPLKMGADEEIETGSGACCRIWFESGSGRGDELICPCMCKGTQQFVHRSCLDHWRSVRDRYVVEDLRGGYTRPKMNPEHEQRLKMLYLM